MTETKTCITCGNGFTRGEKILTSAWMIQVYCSPFCRRRATKQRAKARESTATPKSDTAYNRRAVEVYLARVRESAQKQRQRRETVRVGMLA